jgi:hypothetical protein
MNWKIVSKIATAAGLISIVFTVISAILTYNLIAITTFQPPMDYVQMTLLSEMRPYLFYTVVAFTVSAFASRSAKAATPEQTQSPAMQPQLEAAPAE